MCGRYSLVISPDEIKERFKVKKIDSQLRPNANASPSQQLPLITNYDSQRLILATWGMIPAWINDEKTVKRLINARAETLEIKSTFKSAIKNNRCLVIADGFYEWAKITNSTKKQPYLITLKNNTPFAMAGIFHRKKDKNNKEYLEFAIITTAANSLMRKIHTRMPAILSQADEQRWLDNDITLQQAISMLKPYPATKMQLQAISSDLTHKRQTNKLPGISYV